MLVYVEDIQQSMTLRTGQVRSYLTLKLPSGVTINVPVEEEQIKAILEASVAAGEGEQQPEQPEEQYQPPAPDEFPPMVQEPEGTEEEQVSADDLVSWEELPDTVLSDSMKQILREVGASPEMPMNSLVTLVDDIAERMMQQAEAKAQGAVQPAPAQVDPQYADWPAKPAKAPQKPPQGKVNQPVGRVIVPQSPPIRSVQKDELGYPVVPGMVNDPGEIPAFGDEDGVPGI